MPASVGIMYELTADRELGVRGKLGIAGMAAGAHNLRAKVRTRLTITTPAQSVSMGAHPRRRA